MKKYWRELAGLLGPEGVKSFSKLILVAILSALVQVAGVGSVIPFMGMVANPQLSEDNVYLKAAYDFFGFSSYYQFVVATGLAMVVSIALANLITAYTTWYTLKFSIDQHIRLSDLLIKNYSYQPYQFFLTNNTSDLSKNILHEVNSLVTGYIEPVARICTSMFTVTLLLFALFAAEPFVAISAALMFGIGYTLIYRLSRNWIKELGEIRMEAEREKFKVSAELLGGQREARMLDCREFFLDRYHDSNTRASLTSIKASVVGQFPRLGLEVIAFSAIIMIFVYFVVSGRALRTFLPIISFYAVCGIRVLPQIQQIYSSLTSISYSRSMVERLLPTVNDKDIAVPSPLRGLEWNSRIELRHIKFCYSRDEALVLDDINLSIRKNTAVAFVGQTGSGKTTLVNIILGLLSPTEGVMEVDTTQISEDNHRDWQAKIGLVPQDIFLLDDTIASNIAFGVPEPEIDGARIREVVAMSKLQDYVDKLPDGVDTVIGEKGVRMSGGQRQRLGIARALYRDPELLVFDEATSALDGVTETALMASINGLKSKITMILIAHRVTTLQECDEIHVVEGGKIVASGSYSDLLAENETFQRYANASVQEGE